MGGNTHEQHKTTVGSGPAARTNGTTTGTGVDTQGADSCQVVIITGNVTDGSHAVTVEESAVIGSGYAAVPAGQRTVLPTITSADGNKVFMIGIYMSVGKPFVRVIITTTGATTGGIIGSWINIGGDGVKLPLN
jgi:hypothetical protein